jgi:hypothetical protein
MSTNQEILAEIIETLRIQNRTIDKLTDVVSDLKIRVMKLERINTSL